MAARYRHYYGKFDEHVLCAPWMVAEMVRRAELGKLHAEAHAPYDPDDPDLVHYRDHFEVEGLVGKTYKGVRAIGRLKNTDMPTAEFVEFGTVNNPRRRVLGNALDAMGG